MVWRPRLANEDDIPALEALIPISVKTLQVRQTYEMARRGNARQSGQALNLRIS